MFSKLVASFPAGPRDTSRIVDVQPGPGGFGYDVLHADGEAVPAVPQADNGTVPCPHCRSAHTHGVADEKLSHRVAHCASKTPEARAGYYVMRPLRGLIGRVNWWRSKSDAALSEFGSASLNGGANVSDVPGLLPAPDAREGN